MSTREIESYIGANKQASQRFAYDELGRLSEVREYMGDNNSLTYKQKFDFDRFGNCPNNPTTGQQNLLPYRRLRILTSANQPIDLQVKREWFQG